MKRKTPYEAIDQKVMPMIPARIRDRRLGQIKYPMLAYPLPSGLAFTVHPEHGVISTNGKKVPAKHVQDLLHRKELYFYEGYIGFGNLWDAETTNRTKKAFLKEYPGMPPAEILLTDDKGYQSMGFEPRIEGIRRRIPEIRRETSLNISTPHVRDIRSRLDLRNYERLQQLQGARGVILMKPDGLYKSGHISPGDGIAYQINNFRDAVGHFLAWSPEGEAIVEDATTHEILRIEIPRDLVKAGMGSDTLIYRTETAVVRSEADFSFFVRFVSNK